MMETMRRPGVCNGTRLARRDARKYAEVVASLRRKESIRHIARQLKVTTSLVQGIKRREGLCKREVMTRVAVAEAERRLQRLRLNDVMRVVNWSIESIQKLERKGRRGGVPDDF